MIDLFLKLIDRLVDLLRARDKRASSRYEEIYKPSFDDLQAVYTDYLAMLGAFQVALDRVPDDAGPSDPAGQAALALLRDRRTALSPVRQKLMGFRSVLDEGGGDQLPAVEESFLWSLVHYFESAELLENEGTTFSTDLLDRLQSALAEQRRIDNSENEPDFDSFDGRVYSVREVRETCKDVIDHLEHSWKKVIEHFNIVRFNVARHAS